MIIFPSVVFVFFSTISPAFAGEFIKVGIVDCYSGPPGVYTNDVRDAFNLAIEKANAKGGVAGKKIKFITRDSRFKVDIGLSAAKELIMRENVDIGTDHPFLRACVESHIIWTENRGIFSN